MRIPFGRSRCLVLEFRRRCQHDVLGVCPRCYPAEARTLRNKKLALALAWLERIETPDPVIVDLRQAQAMARSARYDIAKLRP